MALPFYVVYFRSEDDPDALELRAVSIVEHPIESDNAPG
jgi:hypothetical protein